MNTLERFMMLTRVLVVGGSGFIGKHLLRLQPDWVNVDLKEGKNFCEVNCDGYDAIVLLAAELGSDPSDYWLNLKIFTKLAEIISGDADPPFVLYVSSAAVYEPSRVGEHYEDEMPRPFTLYGKSKLLGEQIVQDLCDKYTILRLSNVYGGGEGHGAIDIFKRGQNVIYGDGEQVRDFIPVAKVAEVISRVIMSPNKHAGKIYNVSTGRGLTVNEVYEKYGRGEPRHLPARPGDVVYSVLSNNLARSEGLL